MHAAQDQGRVMHVSIKNSTPHLVGDFEALGPFVQLLGVAALFKQAQGAVAAARQKPLRISHAGQSGNEV